MGAKEQRDGVDLSNLDEPLTPDAGATKRDLVDYLAAVVASPPSTGMTAPVR